MRSACKEKQSEIDVEKWDCDFMRKIGIRGTFLHDVVAIIGLIRHEPFTFWIVCDGEITFRQNDQFLSWDVVLLDCLAD